MFPLAGKGVNQLAKNAKKGGLTNTKRYQKTKNKTTPHQPYPLKTKGSYKKMQAMIEFLFQGSWLAGLLLGWKRLTFIGSIWPLFSASVCFSRNCFTIAATCCHAPSGAAVGLSKDDNKQKIHYNYLRYAKKNTGNTKLNLNCTACSYIVHIHYIWQSFFPHLPRHIQHHCSNSSVFQCSLSLFERCASMPGGPLLSMPHTT